MKKNVKVFLVFTVCVLMMFSGMALSSVGVSAAAKTQGTVDLQKKALIIRYGKKIVLRQNKITIVKGCRYQVKAGSIKSKLKSSKPSVLSVSKKIITAKRPGSAKLKVTYKGKTQSFKIKVIASHKHIWKIAKKATCKTKGVETCTNCGLQNTLPKTSHNYKTDVWKMVEHRGKAFSAYTSFCNGCDADMTNWTKDKITVHQGAKNLENPDHFDCFMAAIHGVAGETRYPEYVKVEITDVRCENCGVRKGEEIVKDLYRCDKYGNKIPDGETSWSVYDFDNYCDEHRVAKFLCADKHPTSTAKKAAARKAVADPQDVITDVSDKNAITEDANLTVSGNETFSENIVSENAISNNSIYEKEIVSDSGTVIDYTDSGLDADIIDLENVVILIFGSPTDGTFDDRLPDDDR